MRTELRPRLNEHFAIARTGEIALEPYPRGRVEELGLVHIDLKPIGLAGYYSYVGPDAANGFAAAQGEDQHRIGTSGFDYVYGAFEIENVRTLRVTRCSPPPLPGYKLR